LQFGKHGGGFAVVSPGAMVVSPGAMVVSLIGSTSAAVAKNATRG